MKPGAGHALGDRAQRLDHHALVALEVEAAFDDFLGRKCISFTASATCRASARAQAARAADQAVDAFGQDHDVGENDAAVPVGLTPITLPFARSRDR